jgi:hypothetical protein
MIKNLPNMAALHRLCASRPPPTPASRAHREQNHRSNRRRDRVAPGDPVVHGLISAASFCR